MNFEKKNSLLIFCSKALLPSCYKNPRKTAQKIAGETLGQRNHPLIFEATNLLADFILFCYKKRFMSKERQRKASKYLIRHRLRNYSFVVPRTKEQLNFFSKKLNITEEEVEEFMNYVKGLSQNLKEQLP